jgi:AraC family transcriptional regulator
MSAMEQVVWYIESHFMGGMTLDDIAAFAGVSRFQMSHAFSMATGSSVIAYVRGRRLSEAARRLAAGAPDILSVALDTGYGSHEAFTRAFRDQFGLTPEQVRAQRSLDKLDLVEPMKLDQRVYAKLEPPRFADGKAMTLAGFLEHYTMETRGRIPAQWQRFGPHFGHVPGQTDMIGYGVILDSGPDGGFNYLCGVEISPGTEVPREFTTCKLSAQRYAVFAHPGHVSSIGETFDAIFNVWLPESGTKMPEDRAYFFERYGPEFDPVTGNGGCEIWIPVQR